MHRPTPTNKPKKNSGGYKLKVAPGKPEKLYIGTYWPNELVPQFEIICNPNDDSVAYHPAPLDQEDGSTKHYYWFDNYGLVTAEVTMRRIG